MSLFVQREVKEAKDAVQSYERFKGDQPLIRLINFFEFNPKMKIETYTSNETTINKVNGALEIINLVNEHLLSYRRPEMQRIQKQICEKIIANDFSNDIVRALITDQKLYVSISTELVARKEPPKQDIKEEIPSHEITRKKADNSSKVAKVSKALTADSEVAQKSSDTTGDREIKTGKLEETEKSLLSEFRKDFEALMPVLSPSARYKDDVKQILMKDLALKECFQKALHNNLNVSEISKIMVEAIKNKLKAAGAQDNKKLTERAVLGVSRLMKQFAFVDDPDGLKINEKNLKGIYPTGEDDERTKFTTFFNWVIAASWLNNLSEIVSDDHDRRREFIKLLASANQELASTVIPFHMIDPKTCVEELTKTVLNDITEKTKTKENLEDVKLELMLELLKENINKSILVSFLKDAGFKAIFLKEQDYDPMQLKNGGYTLQELREAKFTGKELREAKFTLAEFRAAGFNLEDLIRAGFSTDFLMKNGFTKEQLVAVGFNPDYL